MFSLEGVHCYIVANTHWISELLGGACGFRTAEEKSRVLPLDS